MLDPAFDRLVDATSDLTRLASGCEWAEGPVWLPRDASLIWSDIPNDRMLRWQPGGGVSVFRHPSNFANGNTLDREGRLVTCEHTSHRVSRTEVDGTVTSLVERYRGKRLNSPNDLAVRSDGTIWFTDPPYGILSSREGRVRDSDLDGNWVFRLDPATETLEPVLTDFVRPNGIAFSPDERQLFVSDSGPARHIRMFDLPDGQSPVNGRVFATSDVGVSDGFRFDALGNLWTSAGDGVHVYAPNGRRLGKILVPEKVSNLTFGGLSGRTLFITASTSVYAIEVRTSAAVRPTI